MPSLGREHTPYRRKPTTGTRCPTLFDKWHGIFYIPSRTDTAGHTKAFIYLVMDHWVEVKVLWHETDSNRRPVGPQSNTPTTRPRWPATVGGSIIPRTLNGGGGGGGSSPYYILNSRFKKIPDITVEIPGGLSCHSHSPGMKLSAVVSWSKPGVSPQMTTSVNGSTNKKNQFLPPYRSHFLHFFSDSAG